MKKQNKTILTVAAVAAGALLLAKKSVSGVGVAYTEKELAGAENMDIWVMNVQEMYFRYMDEIRRYMFQDGRGRAGAKQRVMEMLLSDYYRGKFDRSSWRSFNKNARSLAADRILDYYVNS